MVVAPLREVLGYERDALRYEKRGYCPGGPARDISDCCLCLGRKRHSTARPAPTLWGPVVNILLTTFDFGRFTDSQSSMIATARVHPAEARSIFTGKQETVKPVAGSCSRLCSFSMWQ